MTKQEFAIFASLLKTSYPRETLLPNRESMELWYTMLSEIPYKQAEIFLKKWLSTQKWSPAISEILEGCKEITEGELPDWGIAWQETLKAVSRYGMYNEEKALQSLSPLTREAVERLGWKSICQSENESVDRANFRMVYERLEKRAKEDRQLPQALRDTLQTLKIGGSDGLLQIGGYNT